MQLLEGSASSTGQTGLAGLTVATQTLLPGGCALNTAPTEPAILKVANQTHDRAGDASSTGGQRQSRARRRGAKPTLWPGESASNMAPEGFANTKDARQMHESKAFAGSTIRMRHRKRPQPKRRRARPQSCCQKMACHHHQQLHRHLQPRHQRSDFSAHWLALFFFLYFSFSFFLTI